VAKKPRTPPPPRSGQPRPVQAPQRRHTAGASGDGRRKLLLGGGAAAVIAVVVVLVVVFAGGSSGGSSAKYSTIDWRNVPNLQQSPPPWPADWQNLPPRLAVLGLNQLGQEGQVIHIHQYLSLWVNGVRVTLPPNVGIYDNSFITELHVHVGEPNIIHVESPTHKDFYLGQIFGEWGVKLTRRCVGTVCGKLSWWVNGTKQTGDPESLKLQEHQVIVIALGKPPKTIQKTFTWGTL
jgi:hypothetical protein